MRAWWDWWLDCPLWKPFVDYLRQCPRSGDLIPPSPSVWQKRSPLYGLAVLMFVFGAPLCLLMLIGLHYR